MTALHLTEQLISRRSVTPDDGGCQQLLRAAAGAAGLRLRDHRQRPGRLPRHQPVGQAQARRADARTLVFAGHTDVVPTGPLEQWTSDPFVPAHRDGKLYGRGAADMKTSIAAFVVAVEEFLAAHPDPAISHRAADHQRRGRPRVDGTVVVCEQLQARGERSTAASSASRPRSSAWAT